MDEEATNGDVFVALRRDLARKYKLHGPKVEEVWRSLSQVQRIRAMKASARMGAVLKNPSDMSMGNARKFIPEWNLHDITAPDSDSFLRLLKHRATMSLEDQYITGFDGRPGDHEHITEMMRTQNLRHINPFENEFTLFIRGEYGHPFKFREESRALVLAVFATPISAGLCIPRSVGELVITRQVSMLKALNLMIDDVLSEGSTSRIQKGKPEKSPAAASVSAALSNLAITEARHGKVELLELLIAHVLDLESFHDKHLGFLCSMHAVLEHNINAYFLSRPELLADERGRRLPALTDYIYISSSVLETVHGVLITAATWNYICRLLKLYKVSTDKIHQATLLQEVSNVCHLEYNRAQSVLKRPVSTGVGSKWFNRVSSLSDNRGQDPQLHCILRLCQPKTNASKSLAWTLKLDELYRANPAEYDNMEKGITEPLCDLTIIARFILSMSLTVPLPKFSRKKGQLFVSRVTELEAALNRLTPRLDLTEFAAPIKNLLEPGMAEGVLRALDDFILENIGTKMGLLYEDIIADCIAKASFTPLLSGEPIQPRQVIFQERKVKEKTRPLYSSNSQVSPPTQHPDKEDDAHITHVEPLIVKPAAAETFSALFSKLEARGSISWTAFEAAMADLGFSVIPEYGSVYTFEPPSSLALKKSIKLHRPHKSRIEGYRLISIARRLNREYAWTATTFKAL
ncbi:hypothetical protein F4677DRAFT_457030 [Hypoxylon crocopeplum]|nr:hypothetical protein F4677DRAFT_457030 [Hypoxylon crocopeplum]